MTTPFPSKIHPTATQHPSHNHQAAPSSSPQRTTAEQLQLSYHSGSQHKARGTSLQTELVSLALSSWPSYPASCVAPKTKLPHETRICRRGAGRCKTVNSKTQPQPENNQRNATGGGKYASRPLKTSRASKTQRARTPCLAPPQPQRATNYPNIPSPTTTPKF